MFPSGFHEPAVLVLPGDDVLVSDVAAAVLPVEVFPMVLPEEGEPVNPFRLFAKSWQEGKKGTRTEPG